MKRVQQSTNTNMNTNPDTDTEISRESENGTGKRKRAKENNESSVFDADEVHSSTSGSTSRSSDVDGENVTSGTSNHDNGNSYNLRSKNPPLSLSSDSDGDDDDVVISNLRSNRLQQPPVYINPNLMKVKMECDYNPIVLLKREPAEKLNQEMGNSKNGHENETEQDQVPCSFSSASASTSASVQRKHSKTNQSEQEKVAVNVEDCASETIVTENETERRNEELKRKEIGNLEERIKEYAQQVISLSREKIEIQMTLQNKIHELNLVMKQQQIEIQDLHSTVTYQRKEISLINAQNNLKQEEIEKLNNKLKCHDENQKSAENSNPSPNFEANLNPVQIGVFPVNILSRIFDLLDIQSLKESRLVCRHWRNEAGKILLDNFYLVFSKKERCEVSLKSWLENSDAIPNSASTSAEAEASASNLASVSKSTAAAQKLWIKPGFLDTDNTRDRKRIMQFLAQSPMLRDSVREFKLSTSYTNVLSDTSKRTALLFEILRLCPNLKVVETGQLDLYPKQKWFPGHGRRGCPVNLEMFLRKLETLEKLKLDFCMRKSAAGQFLSHAERFVGVKSMEIRVEGMSFMRQFIQQNFHHQNLNITRFTLEIQANYNEELTRHFLQRISQSLQHLKLIVAKNTFRKSSSALQFNFEPWTDDWMIPLGLTRVETMEIEFRPQEVALEEFMLKNILVALRLPRLKKLTVGFIPEKLQQIIHHWNGHSHESATGNGRKLSSESLEELEILESFSESSKCKIPANPWPRLKSLKCWGNPDYFDLSILSELRNLERLELNMSSESTKEEKQYKGNSSNFQLRDLKNLKSFSLKSLWKNYFFQPFAHGLIEQDLKFMKSLQLVQFHRIVIGAEPLKCLKSALGPNVPNIFTE